MMNSSGIKRGLAVTAVAALAAVGIPLASQANTVVNQLDAQYGDRTVTLYSQSTGKATVKSDGTNTTIRLEAGATSDISTVRFQYSTDAGVTWNTIQSVGRNDNGAFSFEWNAAGVVGSTVLLRAIGHSVVDGADHQDSTSVDVQGAGGADNAVNLADGPELGVYRSSITGDDNVIVNGTASAGTTDVSRVTATGAHVNTESLGGTSFRGVLDIAGYNFNAPDELVLGAVNGTDDVESYSLYRQVITAVTPTPANPNPPTPATSTNVAVKVTDQKGKPIAGVPVTKYVAGFPTGTDFTDANGESQFTQTVNQGAVKYLANETATPGYQPELGDVQTELVLGPGFASSLVPASANGAAFDIDEYDAGDITVQVRDQGNSNFDVPNGQDLSYNWKITPFDGGEPTTSPAEVDTTDVNGLFDVNLPSGPSGTYELFASLSEGGTGHPIANSKIATYKVGQGKIVFDGEDPQVAKIGTTADVTGKLALEDGTPLSGREITLSFILGTEYDEDGSTGEADAAIITNTLVTTSAPGAFSLKVEDLAETDTRSELGGEVRAESDPLTSANPQINGDNWGASGPNVAYHGVDFMTDQVPAGAKLTVTYDNTEAGPAGTVEDLDIHLEDAFGDDLAGVLVTLDLDHGFFVDDNNGYGGYKAPEAGNYQWTPDSIGSTITVGTGASGNADADATIGRDAGFDDDGKVTAKVTGAVDGVSANDSIVWSSEDPLAVGEVSLVRTPGQTKVDPASTDRGVKFDLYAKDQFGNAAKGVNVEVDCAIELGDDDPCPTGDGVTFPWNGESDFDNGGDLIVYSEQAGTFTYPAVAANPVTRKFDDDLVLQEVAVKTSATQEFYEAVPTTFSMTAPTSAVGVGRAATAKVKVLDQKGNPVEGLDVEFVRTGDQSPYERETNSQGEAAYVFNRTSAGTETVTAVVRGWDDEILKELRAKVVFGSTQSAISAKVTTASSGAYDLLNVNGPSKAKGATVTLYRLEGVRRIKVRTAKLNSAGNVLFTVPDVNGSKGRSTFQVVISATPTTKRFVSGLVRLY